MRDIDIDYKVVYIPNHPNISIWKHIFTHSELPLCVTSLEIRSETWSTPSFQWAPVES